MNGLKLFLIASTVMIYGVTLLAVQAEGFFWPAVYFGDLADSTGERNSMRTSLSICFYSQPGYPGVKDLRQKDFSSGS